MNIDVSKCQFYQNGICYNNGSWGSDFFECAINNNCYYKQLQALKQENEELKKQYNCYICGNCKGKEDYSNLERHYENALKSLHKQYKKLEKIKEIVSEPCIADKNCSTCEVGCPQKDILNIIESEE